MPARYCKVDVETELRHQLGACPPKAAPEFVFIFGAPAVGKTTFRRRTFGWNHVVIDAGELFLSLCCGRCFAFPPQVFQRELHEIGQRLLIAALRERRDLVMEFVEEEVMDRALSLAKAYGYQTNLVVLTCDVQEALRRNANRGDDSISAYYADPIHDAWMAAARQQLGV